MSFYAQHWTIDDVPAAFVARGQLDGRYWVLFERAAAELPRIEAIHWDSPRVVHLTEREETALPEGYGFTVVGIQYLRQLCSYMVELQVAERYLGDAAGYQAQPREQEAAR